MGYLKSECFLFDLFISYSHIDNEIVNSKEKGYITQFKEHLEIALNKRIGKKNIFSIWWDKKLSGNSQFNKDIEHKIAQSALFLAITSNSYVNSDYCYEELYHFYKLNNQTLCNDNKIRMFNARLSDVYDQYWPKIFIETPGFCFFSKEKDHEIDTPLHPCDPDFEKEMDKLANAIFKMLKTIKDEQESVFPKDVYLAPVAISLRACIRQLNKELEKNAVNISESVPPPYEYENFITKAKSKIANSQLYVHLIDEFEGTNIINQYDSTYSHEQIELSLTNAKRKLFFLKEELAFDSISNKKHRELIERIYQENSDEIIPFSLKPENMYYLACKIAKYLRKKECPKNDFPGSLLVEIHPKDRSIAKQFFDYFSKKEISYRLNLIENNRPYSYFDTINKLREVEAVVIFYGEVDSVWIKNRSTQLLKFISDLGFQDKKIYIYLAPSTEREKEIPDIVRNFINFEIIDNTKNFNPENFQPIIKNFGL